MLVISFGQGFEKNSEYDLRSLSLRRGMGIFPFTVKSSKNVTAPAVKIFRNLLQTDYLLQRSNIDYCGQKKKRNWNQPQKVG